MHDRPEEISAPRAFTTTHEGRGVFIVTPAGHELSWLLGKAGAPRRPRTVHCGRCDARLYLSDDFDTAVLELRAIIEQHGGASCP